MKRCGLWYLDVPDHSERIHYTRATILSQPPVRSPFTVRTIMSELFAGAIATASLRYHANNSQDIDADAPVYGFNCCLCDERAPHS